MGPGLFEMNGANRKANYQFNVDAVTPVNFKDDLDSQIPVSGLLRQSTKPNVESFEREPELQVTSSKLLEANGCGPNS